jgi:hypothetical protein
VRIRVNGKEIGQRVVDGESEYKVAIPKGYLNGSRSPVIVA